MLNDYIVGSESDTITLNGKSFPDYHVSSVKADCGNKVPSDFACANSYTVKLHDDDYDDLPSEMVYRKDCTPGLIEFFLDCQFPG